MRGVISGFWSYFAVRPIFAKSMYKQSLSSSRRSSLVKEVLGSEQSSFATAFYTWKLQDPSDVREEPGI